MFFTANDNQIISGIIAIDETKKVDDIVSPSATLTDDSAKEEVVGSDNPDGNKDLGTPKEDDYPKAVKSNLQDSVVPSKPESDFEGRSFEDDDDKSEMSERTRRDNKVMLEVFDANVSINKTKRTIKLKLASLSAKRRGKFNLFIFCFCLRI